MNFIPSIKKEEIAQLPIETYNARICVIDQLEQVEGAVRFLSSCKAVGFDTETRPNFSKNQHHKVSLFQFASDERCYLFRINQLGGIPSKLLQFINGDTIKIGLSLLDDFHGMRKHQPDLMPNNFIDLQKYAPSFGIQDASLQKIYAILFKKKISKRAQLSNWENETLTDAQLNYAALDAWACLRIYQFLNLSK